MLPVAFLFFLLQKKQWRQIYTPKVIYCTNLCIDLWTIYVQLVVGLCLYHVAFVRVPVTRWLICIVTASGTLFEYYCFSMFSYVECHIHCFIFKLLSNFDPLIYPLLSRILHSWAQERFGCFVVHEKRNRFLGGWMQRSARFRLNLISSLVSKEIMFFFLFACSWFPKLEKKLLLPVSGKKLPENRVGSVNHSGLNMYHVI